MKLLITVDTEEDNWGHYAPAGHTVTNIERLPDVQAMLDEYGVKPTYLVTYPVVADDRAAAIIADLARRGGCEVGSHCHPWNTPPFEESNTPRNSMLCNLDDDLQHRKIRALHELIGARLGIQPVSFRAGRWAYGPAAAAALASLEYRVDSSISPYMDWRPEHGPDYSLMPPDAYRCHPKAPFTPCPDGELVEVPLSVGYLQRHAAFRNRLFHVLSRPPWETLRLHALLHRLGAVNRVWLSPEGASSAEMIALCRRLMKQGIGFLNMMFHSPSLRAGLTPYVRTRDDERRLFERIRDVVRFARDHGVESITLSEAARSV